jgi:hypothetical protein
MSRSSSERGLDIYSQIWYANELDDNIRALEKIVANRARRKNSTLPIRRTINPLSRNPNWVSATDVWVTWSYVDVDEDDDEE